MEYQQFINGEWVKGEGHGLLVDRDPYDESILAEITPAGIPQVSDAYLAARTALPGWAALPASAKANILLRVAALIRERWDELVEDIIRELGGTKLKAEFELGLAIEFLQFAAEIPARITLQDLPSSGTGAESRVYRDPLGVVAVIAPFNFPFFLAMKVLVQALACGNAVVLKPHEEAAIVGGAWVAELFHAAGLPAGVLNVLITDIPTIGDAMIAHPDVDMIAFTGSDATGRYIAQVAAKHLKPYVLEMGGNSPFIVLDDADLDLAVDAAVFSGFTHQGQICMSARRVLVARSIYQQFRDPYVAKVRSLPCGDPRDPSTIIGPLINHAAVLRLERQIETALAEGARAPLLGEARGNVYTPTVFDGVPSNMSIAQEELFGPVACLIPFDTDDEAVQIANDSRYGLSGAVHSRDIARATRIARRLITQMCHVNDTTIHDDPNAPFGGARDSGIGAINGDAGIATFTRPRWLTIRHERPRFPY